MHTSNTDNTLHKEKCSLATSVETSLALWKMPWMNLVNSTFDDCIQLCNIFCADIMIIITSLLSIK